MFKPVVHKDWYRDGAEDIHYDGPSYTEELWRLDFGDFQAQLFARQIGPDDAIAGYEKPRLFLQKDVRDPSGEIRVHYACQAWPLTEEEAQELLEMDRPLAVIWMTDKINEVDRLPNRPEYCGSPYG